MHLIVGKIWDGVLMELSSGCSHIHLIKTTARNTFALFFTAMTTIILVLLFLCSLALVRVARRRRTPLPLPPGPSADPIIGHLRIMPDNDTAAETFHSWSQKYGDVMYLEVLGKPIVVLSSEVAATDLLDKRSLTYSSRPSFPIFER